MQHVQRKTCPLCGASYSGRGCNCEGMEVLRRQITDIDNRARTGEPMPDGSDVIDRTAYQGLRRLYGLQRINGGSPSEAKEVSNEIKLDWLNGKINLLESRKFMYRICTVLDRHGELEERLKECREVPRPPLSELATVQANGWI